MQQTSTHESRYQEKEEIFSIMVIDKATGVYEIAEAEKKMSIPLPFREGKL